MRANFSEKGEFNLANPATKKRAKPPKTAPNLS